LGLGLGLGLGSGSGLGPFCLILFAPLFLISDWQ
jgi:hypothetical protein